MGFEADFPGPRDQSQNGQELHRRPGLEEVWRYQQPQRKKALNGLESWLRERFRRHGGNVDVLRQELAADQEIAVSLRTVKRAVQPYRQELAAEARATVRFETAPDKQMQIDFGERLVEIGGANVRAYCLLRPWVFASQPCNHVRAFRNERQESWFDGLEACSASLAG